MHFPPGVHSGDSSGVIPDTFRIARHLLDRIENSETGDVLVPECHADIPDVCAVQARGCRPLLPPPGTACCSRLGFFIR